MNRDDLIDAGWKQIQVGGFTDHAGPFRIRKKGDRHESGLLVEPVHCNNHMGTIHGGVVMTFADIALGVGVGEVVGGPNMVTIQLQLHFVSTARVGDFLTCLPEVVRQTRQLVFVRGLIYLGDKTVAGADGIWKVIDPAKIEGS